MGVLNDKMCKKVYFLLYFSKKYILLYFSLLRYKKYKYIYFNEFDLNIYHLVNLY